MLQTQFLRRGCAPGLSSVFYAVLKVCNLLLLHLGPKRVIHVEHKASVPSRDLGASSLQGPQFVVFQLLLVIRH